jgi:hypothetical protein
VRLTAPPVVGGVLLGMEQVGIRTAAVRQRLNESAKRLVGLRSTEALKY